MNMTDKSDEELRSSKLGTRDYWEEVYSLEISNFKNHGDVGEVWFGEDSALRIVRWMGSKPELIKKDDKIIDLGCGNGMMLIELVEEGFVNLTGVDYSRTAIDLASRILRSKGFTSIELKVFDILSDDRSEFPSDVKVAHDKGTYDAVSLNPENPREKRRKYIDNVYQILLPGGLLILTSCNWTEDELREHFKNYFDVLQVIPTPSFKFGGHVGNLVTSIVFKKR